MGLALEPLGQRLFNYVHMTFGRGVAAGGVILCGVSLWSATFERDLGIAITTSPKTHEQIDCACASARSMLAVIRWSFSLLSTTTLKILSATYVRFRLEYGANAVFPSTLTDIGKFERI